MSTIEKTAGDAIGKSLFLYLMLHGFCRDGTLSSEMRRWLEDGIERMKFQITEKLK